MLLKPKNAQNYVERGLAHAQRRRYQEALSDFTEAIQLDRTNSQAFYYRGKVYASQNRFDEAADDFRQVIRLDSTSTQTYFYLGGALAKQAAWSEALACFEKAEQRGHLDAPRYVEQIKQILSAKQGINPSSGSIFDDSTFEQPAPRSDDACAQAKAKTRTCPQCHTIIPVYRKFTTWCDQCGWNLQPQEPTIPDDLFTKLYNSIGEKSSRHLYEQMVKAQTINGGSEFAKMLAFFLAGCVYLISPIMVAVGAYQLLAGWPSFVAIVSGSLCLFLARTFFPRVPGLSQPALPREEFPTLYGLVDRIARTLGSQPVDGIVASTEFNAGFGQVGWIQKNILILGLPFFAILTAEEKVALLSHELAHSINGDPTRGLFIGTAIDSLGRCYFTFHLDGLALHTNTIISLILVPFSLLMLPVTAILWLWIYLLSHLTWHDSQRSEYLADLLAAQISGTRAQLRTLEKTHLHTTFWLCLQNMVLNEDKQDFFGKLQQRVAEVPDRELERIRRVELLEGSRLDATHPPTAYRIRFLQTHYASKVKVTLTTGELAQLEQELAPIQKEMQNALIDRYRSSIYY